MSFSFNGPSFRPMIQESQSMKNNGGGGNTGYMQQGRKKKDKKVIDVFSEAQDEADEFVHENGSSQPPKGRILDRIIEKTKEFVNKPQNGSNESMLQEEKNAVNNPFSPLIDEE